MFGFFFFFCLFKSQEVTDEGIPNIYNNIKNEPDTLLFSFTIRVMVIPIVALLFTLYIHRNVIR